MNDVELRERFDQWAAPLRATPGPAIAVIRTRARRRTARLAASAGSALAAAAVAVGLIAGSLGGTGQLARPGPWGSATYPAPRDQPWVIVNESASGPAQLRNMATGTVDGIVPSEGKGAIFTALAAAAGDRLFVLAWQDRRGELGFDAIQIGSRSEPLGPTRLPILSVHGARVYGMSINAAGTRLAFNTIPAGGTEPGTLQVYNLGTGGLIGRWPASGIVSLDYWAAPDQLALHRGPRGGLRILDTDRVFPVGSSLVADTRPDPAVRGYNRGALSADGSMAINVRKAGALMDVQEFSAASGRLVRTVTIGSARALPVSPYFCGVLWASANGRDLLTQCGSRQQEVTGGRVTRTRLAWTMLAQQDGAIDTFAW